MDERHFNYDQLSPHMLTDGEKYQPKQTVMVEMLDYSAKWNHEDEKPVLKDIDILMEDKSLHVVVGPVACGKVSKTFLFYLTKYYW